MASVDFVVKHGRVGIIVKHGRVDFKVKISGILMKPFEGRFCGEIYYILRQILLKRRDVS